MTLFCLFINFIFFLHTLHYKICNIVKMQMAMHTHLIVFQIMLHKTTIIWKENSALTGSKIPAWFRRPCCRLTIKFKFSGYTWLMGFALALCFGVGSIDDFCCDAKFEMEDVLENIPLIKTITQ